MNNGASRLRSLRSHFVDRAVYQLARGEGLRAMAAEQITRFYSLLEEVVENGNPEWLDPCLQDWASARSHSAFGERLTLLPVLDVLKAVAWEVVRELCAPAEALEMIVVLELGFVHAQSFLAVLEVEALLGETLLKLEEAEENLDRLERSKADFVTLATHELKTPLTLIEGYADMLTTELEAAGKPGAMFLITGITKGISRLRDIVEDLVDLSMIDNQALSLALQPIKLLKLLAQAQAELETALRERQLRLTLDSFEGDADAIVADPLRLLQVFRHVIGNAVKYTPDGGLIRVSGRRRPGFVEVMVADSGIGIAPEHQQRIFERFSPLGDIALHSTSKTKFKGGGIGLGLAIAKGIIEAHGGAIWCESPGYDEQRCPGSTFHIMIPEMPLTLDVM